MFGNDRFSSCLSWLLLMLGAWLLAGCGPNRPAGPAEVIWDKDVCANCSMHLGDPAFAAQLRTAAGETLFFDDPGCLFVYLAAHPGLETDGMWFRHVHEERWVGREQVGFVAMEKTPMGFGIGAVDAGGEGAMTFEAARQKVLASRHIGGSGADSDGDGMGPTESRTTDHRCPCCRPAGDRAATEGGHASE